MLTAGLVLAFRAQGRHALRGRLAVPMALLAGAIVFLLVTVIALLLIGRAAWAEEVA